jgi:mono/diheme cytochrome c family protein
MRPDVRCGVADDRKQSRSPSVHERPAFVPLAAIVLATAFGPSAESRAQSVRSGAQVYASAGAACHGSDGRGRVAATASSPLVRPTSPTASSRRGPLRGLLRNDGAGVRGKAGANDEHDAAKALAVRTPNAWLAPGCVTAPRPESRRIVNARE